jgi:hypothetical protein
MINISEETINKFKESLKKAMSESEWQLFNCQPLMIEKEMINRKLLYQILDCFYMVEDCFENNHLIGSQLYSVIKSVEIEINEELNK